ncbi:MAG: hypothetical protein ACRCSV_01595 [Chlamydiales bacterium]
MGKILFRCIYIYCLCISIAYCNETREELDKSANNKLDNSLRNATIGAAAVGYGMYEASKGNPVAGAVSAGYGVNSIKDLIKDFNEARNLKQKARDMNGNK